MTNRLIFAVLAVALGAAVAAEVSGPAKGTSPMLTIKPANRDGDPYCVTCEAGTNPAVVAFLTADDEATRKLLKALHEQARAGRDQDLGVTAIVLGTGAVPQALVAFARHHHLDLPVAVLARDADGLEDWKINDKVSNTVVFFDHHKVVRSDPDLAAGELPGKVKDLLHHHNSGGHGHH